MVTLPKIIKKVRHRPLEPVDLQIIFAGAGSWSLYYQFLYYTGLRAGDVAMLTYGNIDRKKKAISSVRLGSPGQAQGHTGKPVSYRRQKRVFVS